MRERLPVLAAALWWGSLTAMGFAAVPMLFNNTGIEGEVTLPDMVMSAITYDVTDKLNLTAGARYFKYTKNIIGETLVPSILVGAVVTPPTLVQSDEKGWVFRFNGSYKIKPDVMVYAEA